MSPKITNIGFALALVMLLVTGCASYRSLSLRIDPGADKSHVTQILGEPYSRETSGTREVWFYLDDSFFGYNDFVAVWIDSGRVTAIKNQTCYGAPQADWSSAPAGQGR